MEFDETRLATELVRAIRGRRSQVAFSRRLGFRSNVAAAWEGGRRWPTAARVLAAARLSGVDLEEGLRRFYGVPVPWATTTDPATPEGIAMFLQDNRRNRTLTDLSERTGYSRFQLSRWYRGVAQPRLPELLRLVDASTERLLDYVAVLVDPSVLPSLSTAWTQLESARSLFWRMPHAQLVLLAITLESYGELPAHSDAWLAERLGLEIYQVTGAIEALLATGQLRWHGAHLALGRVQTIDTRRHPTATLALRKYWSERACDQIGGADTSWSWNAFAVSEADRVRIVELYRGAFRQMRAIVAASEPAETLVLVQQAICRVDSSGFVRAVGPSVGDASL